MKILAISGSAAEKSSNTLLLNAIKTRLNADVEIEVYNQIRNFPLFRPEGLQNQIPEIISDFRNKINNSNSIIICTPEYTHNIPAVLKNALEWITSSGEFNNKKILPITFTPQSPRGEFAMQSLLFSLQALNANIVTQLPLYKTDFKTNPEKIEIPDEEWQMIKEAVLLLG
jgi:chromate reductase, NAD(P)H dehydrogenase (quinone)